MLIETTLLCCCDMVNDEIFRHGKHSSLLSKMSGSSLLGCVAELSESLPHFSHILFAVHTQQPVVNCHRISIYL